jgi:hypothetical protein
MPNYDGQRTERETGKFDDGKRVTVFWENGSEQHFFEVENLSMPGGTASRVGGKKAFVFGPGSSDLVFINVTKD